MKIVFWLNSFSPHLAGMISTLSLNHNIVVITPSSLPARRRKMGWTPPDFGEATVLHYENIDDFSTLYGFASIHIFSGLFTYKNTKRHFYKIYQDESKRIFTMMELPSLSGLKGALRYIKYKLLVSRFKGISGYISFGSKKFLERLGVSSNKILDFLYLSDFTPATSLNKEKEIVFIGQIDKNKNVLSLVESFIRSNTNGYSLKIIGNVVDEEILNEINSTKHLADIEIIGSVKSKHIPNYLASAELLVLPSYHDGWGVVVNEALLSSCKVVLSSSCGSNGYFSSLNSVFSFNPFHQGDLDNVLSLALDYKLMDIDFEKANKMIDKDSMCGKLVEFLRYRK
ncbi:glycosyltransferase [Vibrio crassostreae]|uniref:glycosyltransferase n=1 Tax=Vibrio crassostreae TaxID=246167 RepID=UPI000639962B|nr:glycosyltransferase [Vibrio crassostreae]TCO01554.1 glycosyltransferase involved in cell wall biosynthesis [Vibrio crassostreae]TCT51324.1 glycosyltransferase involved in cell wall biosynthesis [Vibrio crassostreae]TCT70265.1 glycosyltransferase involved in cell wall biosynthesis [Vibrio crassostreae]TCT76153.1 glycosyltransferase involved in cell wall biosynthesis [Vibrio crassostreae]TCT95343.1 glycosyltransferase involved in cell wall biosynthesis [Vibrio crassostreae]